MSNRTENRTIIALAKVLAQVDQPEDCRRFLEDLCTPAELRAMADRWRVAKLVAKKVPYREIYEATGVSTATITRVARALRLGSDGYARILRAQGVIKS